MCSKEVKVKLLPACFPLRFACCLLLFVHCSLLPACCSLLFACCLLLSARYSLVFVFYPYFLHIKLYCFLVALGMSSSAYFTNKQNKWSRPRNFIFSIKIYFIKPYGFWSWEILAQSQQQYLKCLTKSIFLRKFQKFGCEKKKKTSFPFYITTFLL